MVTSEVVILWKKGPEGIEPLSPAPEAGALSVELWALNDMDLNGIINVAVFRLEF